LGGILRNRINPEPAGRKARADPVLVVLIILITGLGLVTLYSASYAFGVRFFENGLYFISRQLGFCALGLVLFLSASRFPLDRLRGWIVPLVVGTALACCLTFVPGIGVMKNGAARWIQLGPVGYQPSELVKLVLPLYLAHIFDKKQDRISRLVVGTLPQALITAMFFLIIYRQNNFSTAVFIAANALFIFFVAGIKLRYFFAAAMILFPISTLLVFTKEHRLRRLISFLWPDWEPLGAGYQVRASLQTIGAGGFWGRGLGQGSRKIASVPEIHSDFIFAAYSEEFGFVGILLFCFLFAFFTFRGYQAALRSEDLFRRLLAFGLVTMISSQALLNIAVVSGILPATGIPLPFFSAGGSSLATTLLTAGLIVNLSRVRPAEEGTYV
jgi:cell division protein FtsW